MAALGRQTAIEGVNMSSVVQGWVSNLPMMQQTVLLELTRGPDGVAKYDPSKFLLRYVRRCILYSALDGVILKYPYTPGGGSFTGPSYHAQRDDGSFDDRWWQDRMQELISAYLKGVDAIPHHFHLHLMHGIEILGYKHPDEDIREFWNRAYIRFVHDMHVWPEMEDQMDKRLGDSREGWLERSDPATTA